MLPNTMKHTKTWVYGPIGWIRCVCWAKLQLDFVARTFALIAPVPYVLQQVSCSYETIPNAPKYYETYRNITLGSNWVDWDCPLQKIPTSLRGMNFCINCTSSPRFAPSFMQLRNNPKCTKILQRSNGVDSVRSLQKSPTSLRGTNYSINCTNSPYFAPSFMQLQNDPKCIQTLWNTPKQESRIQWGGSGAFVGKNYNLTSWHELLH